MDGDFRRLLPGCSGVSGFQPVEDGNEGETIWLSELVAHALLRVGIEGPAAVKWASQGSASSAHCAAPTLNVAQSLGSLVEFSSVVIGTRVLF